MEFRKENGANIDRATVEGFGEEWEAFDQTRLGAAEYKQLFDGYFAIFPFADLPSNAEGFDLGCGSGRWADGVIDRVGTLHCIDPSERALAVAQQRLKAHSNVRFHLASVDSIPLSDDSQDFGYSLGVLHHVPNTQQALTDCVRKLKLGAPMLVYLYYKLDDRPIWFRGIWQATDWLRKGIAVLPFPARKLVTTVLAATVYWPLARSARVAEKMGADVLNVPLSPYRERSFYSMRTDALDRFGTRLEQRFSRKEIAAMMHEAGLGEIHFSDQPPYWVACGKRRC